MKVLVVGSGGREHAICYSLNKSPKVTEIHAIPGNPGIGLIGKCHNIKVEDLEGNILYERKLEDELVLNPNYVYILNEMMTNTTNSNFIDYAKPSALSIADKLKGKYAIKTGTTGTDFYLVGYNPDIIMLVWIGYDDSSDLELGKNIYTKNIFADTINNIFKEKEASWYDTPKNVIGIPKNAITGDIADNTSNSAIYYYVKGTENYVFKEE